MNLLVNVLDVIHWVVSKIGFDYWHPSNLLLNFFFFSSYIYFISKNIISFRMHSSNFLFNIFSLLKLKVVGDEFLNVNH